MLKLGDSELNKKDNDILFSMIDGGVKDITLTREDLERALELNGSYYILQSTYEDYANSIESIKKKLSVAKSVLISFEDDNYTFDKIDKFVKQINNNLSNNETFIFGTKSVSKLSKIPVTILVSGILD